MTTRDDITVFYHLDPRLILVARPSNEVTMQDLHDTLMDIDDEPANMVYPHLVQSAGKDDLGGGIKVGITLTLRNAQIAFQRRENVLSTATITADSVPGGPTQKIYASGASFISDGVARGMLVSNSTDIHASEVIIVNSETELTVLSPSAGATGDFTIGDSIQIWETETCNFTGGNLIATDYDGNAMEALFPTYCVTAKVTSSSSATFQEQLDIQHSSFNGGVTVDLSSSYSGTSFPIGTPRQPVNNFSDALTIAQTRGFDTLYVVGDATFGAGLNFSDMRIQGDSQNKSLFVISPACDVINSEFQYATVQGTLDGGNVLTDCALKTIDYVDGVIQSCLLLETITLSGSGDAFFLDCWSGVPGSGTPTIDMGGAGSNLALRNYAGGIKIQNHTGMDATSIDLNSGQIVIDDTIASGDIIIRGVGVWTNKSTYSGTANIVNQLINNNNIADYVWDEQLSGHTVSGSAGSTLIAASGLSGIINANVVQVSGEPVSIKDFVGEAASLTTTAIADAVWDEVLTGATHNIASSAGRRLRDIAGNVIFGGTIASGTINSAYLDTDASATDGAYDPAMIAITTGTGAGQSRLVYQYHGASRRAVVDRDWKVIPDNTSEYIISAHPGREHVNEGLARGGTSNTITLNALASSNPNAYEHQTVFIRSGTGKDQANTILSYDSVTKIATVEDDWDVIPSGDTAYVILPYHTHPIDEMASGVWSYSSRSLTTGATTDIADAVWNSLIETGYNATESMRIILATLAGKISGAEGTDVNIRDINDTKTRVQATVDEYGNRVVIIIDKT